MNRVVITGMGIYSCIGKNLDEVKESLYTGRSGIVYDAIRKDFGYRSGLTGAVEKPNLKGTLDRRARIMLPEQGEYAYIATTEALQQAGIDADYIAQTDVGILYGNDSTAKAVIETTDIIREKKDTMLIGSGAVFQTMNSTVTMNLATIFKLRGVNFTISAACASGSHSIGMGYHLIKSGMQDCIICGGAQELSHYSMGSFDALSAFSVHEADPAKASRPFDRDRDGLVPSGGAATVILESLESALKRGATILGEIVGYGFSSNGGHISNPTVEGPVRSLNMALKDAGIQASEIDYINAHATSTPAGDASEAKAIDEVFGDYKPLVSSTKSMTGHECWMAGASEIVYSMLMMQNSFVAPNINFENPDEDSAKLNIATETVEKNIDTFLSNSFGFGGTNSSLIIKKYI
ncbi:beta-ketoacyl-[acyl-carrier-protein] synthase family protein [Mucilaginibacter rubeus]|uniref:3-oxoacyl-[acyl-carrier-protein] synthase 1 n=1 Tax=Mucilaginibacter rubeus TaxID=2027860 RepID=A0AAE6JJ85_9SPHI|nr:MULTISPECIES: beta-ketoacyl-[acyl-carrier-protein] synthase family protein [Mucilaginibacter]QEM06734.1 beta-ketoacyl-[acyl-carrier-protein] synthase family protein [Mucilaginibacter rubeus]QEM19322.1 beta-ketoacyl-[acyl-carrier-protein] synthase family protein [Mucilaginibacter gossypii]QTE44134.1 beta-ketoacyl-[acyl-carrier-protein] synthase family protein [Mucilaginibacter rubeus]QTE50735.1 beta-ketoacyl-[acyl-carrier-protein] synthase family protein [Mucilaginibacter rubeus]QTE55817.1 b